MRDFRCPAFLAQLLSKISFILQDFPKNLCLFLSADLATKRQCDGANNDEPSSALTLYRPAKSSCTGLFMICEAEPDWINFPEDFFSLVLPVAWNPKKSANISKQAQCKANNSRLVYNPRLATSASATAVKDNSKRLYSITTIWSEAGNCLRLRNSAFPTCDAS